LSLEMDEESSGIELVYVCVGGGMKADLDAGLF